MDGNVVVQAPMGDSDPTADKKARHRAANARYVKKRKGRERALPQQVPPKLTMRHLQAVPLSARARVLSLLCLDLQPG